MLWRRHTTLRWNREDTNPQRVPSDQTTFHGLPPGQFQQRFLRVYSKRETSSASEDESVKRAVGAAFRSFRRRNGLADGLESTKAEGRPGSDEGGASDETGESLTLVRALGKTDRTADVTRRGREREDESAQEAESMEQRVAKRVRPSVNAKH